jgi:K+-transporting ATPase KdpF subunit
MSWFINPQSLVMLAVTVLTMVYLFYALLRPEKF